MKTATIVTVSYRKPMITHVTPNFKPTESAVAGSIGPRPVECAGKIGSKPTELRRTFCH